MTAARRGAAIERFNPGIGYLDPHACAALAVSQIVKAGDTYYLSGVVSSKDGLPVHQMDFRAQFSLVVETLRRLLATVGLDLEQVVSTTIYTSDMEALADHFDLFSSAFADSPPACNWIGVERLASPDYLIELVAVAVR